MIEWIGMLLWWLNRCGQRGDAVGRLGYLSGDLRATCWYPDTTAYAQAFADTAATGCADRTGVCDRLAHAATTRIGMAGGPA